MGLNIKNAETERLVKQLAALTGESLTGAITASVKERLERARAKGKVGRAERLRAIARECAGRLEQPYRSIDHADLLYDDRGLPK